MATTLSTMLRLPQSPRFQNIEHVHFYPVGQWRCSFCSFNPLRRKVVVHMGRDRD